MFKVNTQRLEIIPMDEHNLELCINDFNKMEKNLGFTVTDKNIGSREKDVFKIRLNGVKKNPERYMWYTTWMIVIKSENRIVGHIMIKGFPNEKGETIIGYYMQDGYRKKGYMFEAVKGLVQWMFLNPDVKFVVADTLKSNIPSQNLLKKLGMELYNEDDEWFWWRLKNFKRGNIDGI